ncbi:MAG: stage III sporulation protein AE [Acetobacteraceae bacterium]|nr:stage III sporulation protein AE [Acetobacteraceae bacterium]
MGQRGAAAALGGCPRRAGGGGCRRLPLALALALILGLAAAAVLGGGVVAGAAGGESSLPQPPEEPSGSPSGSGPAGGLPEGGSGDGAGPWPVLAPDEEAWLEEQAGALGLERAEEVLRGATQEWRAYLPDLSLKGMADRLRQGRFPLDLGGLGRGLLRYGFREALAGLRLLGQLLGLAVVCALLGALEAAVSRGGVGRLAHSVCYLALVSLALAGLLVALDVARGTLQGMVSFMLALLPMLVALLAAVGAPVTAGLFHPLMVAVVHTVALGAAQVAFPLLVFSVALDSVGHLAPEHRLAGLSALFRQLAIAGVGVLLCLFLGASVVLGAGGAVADGVALRTAKFLSSTFVPVVGKMFSDASEVILGSSLLLKSAVGLSGAVAVVALAAFPLVKLLSLVLVFRVGAALAQPVAGAGVAGCLESMGSALTLVLLILAAVALMFFLSLVLVLGAGSAAVMLR